MPRSSLQRRKECLQRGIRKLLCFRQLTPVTPLAGRLFGAWTAMAAAIRLLAAYDISNKGLYDLGIVAFGVATFHFVSEWLVFGTVKPNRASIGPLVIGCEF